MATAQSFEIEVSNGEGLKLDLVNKTGSWNATAILSGLEIVRNNADGLATPTADVELSTDGGVSWIQLASGIEMDRFGNGQYLWTADVESGEALIRVSANQGSQPNDLSDNAFSVANGGNFYYVNDDSLLDDEYTTATGDNANDGKNPNTPMASLAALLRLYDLGPGDTVFVDTGVYNVISNIRLEAEDSGVRIQGAVRADNRTVLDRSNTSTGSYVFEFTGADDVTLDSLSITGAVYGVYANYTVDSDRVTLSNNEIFNNSNIGIYIQRNSNQDWTIENNEIYGHNNGGNDDYGIWIENATGVQVLNNDVRANYYGIRADGNTWIFGNDVYSNHTGVYSFGTVLIENNDIYQNSEDGIYLNSSSRAVNNRIYGNRQGIDSRNNTEAYGNRLFENETGLIVNGGNINFYDNYIHNNNTGIYIGRYQAGRFYNNLIYENTSVGILDHSYSGGTTVQIVNNTIYQSVGDAVYIASGTTSNLLQNNIIWVDSGYAINVANGDQTGFQSDRNLFYLGTESGFVGLWTNVQRATLADWQSVTGQESNSSAGVPRFLDIDGADNVLGEQGVNEGGPADDNFGLGGNSPAIDRGNAFVTRLFDALGRQRQDDPGIDDTGIGWGYRIEDLGSSQFVEVGTARGWRSTNTYWNYNLPFAFKYNNVSYTSVQVSTNGYLQFAGPDSASNQNNNFDEFNRNVRIAPLWEDIRTNSSGGNIFIDTSIADQITFRWKGVTQADSMEVNFSVTLFVDGRIRFDYGPGNENLTPTVGLSAGIDLDYLDYATFFLAPYDNQASLTNANSLLWTPEPELTFFDLGAYEFQGDSSDTVVPVVTGLGNVPADGGSTETSTDRIIVEFSEFLDSIAGGSPANYAFIEAGADGVFNTTDDQNIAFTPVYVYPSTQVEIVIDDGLLSSGLYRLTILGDKALFDTAGNKLDGDNDGIAGGDYVHTFTINGNDAPTAANLGTDENYIEDGGTQDLLDIVVSDVDSTVVAVSLKLSNINAGVLSTATSGSVTSTFISGVWTVSGAIDDVNVLLAALTFTPVDNFSQPIDIAVTISDGVNTLTGTKTLTPIEQNDPSVATNLNAAETYIEDIPLNLVNLQVSDIDSAEIAVTFTLSDLTAGSLNTSTSGSVTSTFVNGVWAASGAIARVNSLLAGLTFTPAENYNQNFSIATQVSDGTTTLNGNKLFTGTAQDDAPTVTGLNSPETYTEDAGAIDLADIVVSDIDSTEVAVTLALSDLNAGTLSADTSGSVTASFVNGMWTASGLIADVNTLLSTVTFTPAADYDQDFVITVEVSNTPNTPDGTKAITAIPVNDAPVATGLDTAETYVPNGDPVTVAPIVISDIDGDDLTVTLTLSDSTAGSFGTATSGSVTSTFEAGVWTASGAIADLNNLLANLQYTPAADYNAGFTVAVAVSDGGETVSGVKTFTAAAANNAPVAVDDTATTGRRCRDINCGCRLACQRQRC